MEAVLKTNGVRGKTGSSRSCASLILREECAPSVRREDLRMSRLSFAFTGWGGNVDRLVEVGEGLGRSSRPRPRLVLKGSSSNSRPSTGPPSLAVLLLLGELSPASFDVVIYEGGSEVCGRGLKSQDNMLSARRRGSDETTTCTCDERRRWRRNGVRPRKEFRRLRNTRTSIAMKRAVPVTAPRAMPTFCPTLSPAVSEEGEAVVELLTTLL